MDSVEVAVRFTEAIMANSSTGRKDKNPAQAYAEMFAQMLERVNVILTPVSMAVPRPPRPSQANSTVFPLTHER